MFRRCPGLWFALVAGACAVPVRFVAPKDAMEVDLVRLADDLARADVVVLGENHGATGLHEEHWRILRALHERRPDLILSMEMFERDVQAALWQYLLGDIDESEFLARARPWPNYATDYRPVVEFARARRLEVLAANLPRALARRVAEQGVGAAAGSPHAARATTAPHDDYFAAFGAAMRAFHPGLTATQLEHYYEAQCLKDDTMAEAIVERVRAARRDGRHPLVVHFCGHLHSDHGYGTVARVRQREPGLAVKVVGVEFAAPGAEGTIAAAPSLADYVLVLPASARAPAADPEPASEQPEDVAAPAAPAIRAPAAPSAARPATPAPDAAQSAVGRPGLGFRPEYDAELDGCGVADVLPGGPAEAAGIVPGDVIIAFAGQPIDSVATYSVALGNCAIGDKVDVTVRRGATEVTLPVVVGRSSR